MIIQYYRVRVKMWDVTLYSTSKSVTYYLNDPLSCFLSLFFKTPLRRRHLKVRLKFEERILLLLWASSFATALTFSSCTFLPQSSLLLSLTYNHTISLFHSPSSSLFSSLSHFFLSLSLFLTLIQFHYFNLFHSLSLSLSVSYLSLADLQLRNQGCQVQKN